MHISVSRCHVICSSALNSFFITKPKLLKMIGTRETTPVVLARSQKHTYIHTVYIQVIKVVAIITPICREPSRKVGVIFIEPQREEV